MVTGFCQCPVGKSRGPCKHKNAVVLHKGVSEFNVIPTHDSHMKALWRYIATGHTQPSHMYREDGDNEKPIDTPKFIKRRLSQTEINFDQEENFSISEACNELDHDSEMEEDQFIEKGWKITF